MKKTLGMMIAELRKEKGMTTVDELMQIKREAENPKQSPKEIIQTVFKAVPLAMGVAVVVLAVMDELPIQSGFIMLGIGMFCAGVALLSEKK